MHLVIAAAHSSSPALQQAFAALKLPALDQLLSRLLPGERVATDEMAWSTPYELALARALGLPSESGLIPWAAHLTHTYGRPCAFITPCHWQVHSDHLSLSPPQDLALDCAASQALMALMQGYFDQDGISLRPHASGVWLATGEVFRNLPSASLARAMGRNIDAWMPPTCEPRGASLRRLQNEMQMLLYTHPMNDQRAARGLLPVNSFWVSGAGALAQPAAPATTVQAHEGLAGPALSGDASAYAQAWQALHDGALQSAGQALRQGQALQLSLCGEQASQSWGPAKAGVFKQFLSVLSRSPSSNILNQL